ncbi:MAG: tetratricopeptide repeat protein [Nitrospirae bacterium]|nr:tetratricopeptide repeat protein [Candidatus Manganitrophaceae bacterium]
MKRGVVQTAMLVFLILLVGCGGPEARKAKYTARAQQYIQEENWPKARVALRNVLKIDPKDADATYLYALVEEKEKNWMNAFRYYAQVIELDPDHRDGLIKLSRFYLEGGATDKVSELTHHILVKHPNDPVAETFQAAVLLKKGQKGEAIAQLQKILQRNPGEPDATSLLAAVYTDQKRWEEAEKVLRKAVQLHPENVVLLNNLGNTWVRLERFSETEGILKQIVGMEPKAFEHRVRLAAFYRSRNESAKAEAALREAVRLDPESEERRLVLADFFAKERNLKEGEAILLEAKKALPRSMKIPFALGQFYETTGQGSRARGVYQEIIDQEGTHPQGLEAKVKLATLDLAEGKKEEATARLKEVLQENPAASEALVLKGKMSLGKGEGKEAIQAFRSVLKDQPDRADIHAQLGEAYLLTQEADLARESFERAVALNPSQLEARRALARIDASAGKRKAARDRVEAILKETPNDLESTLMLFGLQMTEPDLHGAEVTLQKARAIGANDFVVGMAEGELYSARREWDKAIASFDRAAALRPDAADPLFARVRIELSRGKTRESLQYLQQVVAARPTHPYAHGMLGEVWLVQREWAAAERELQEASRLKPDWVNPWIERAQIRLSRKQPAEAVSLLESGIASNPKSDELRLLLASVLSDTQQIDRAIGVYESIVKENPKSVVAANNLASLLADKKGDPKSLERALALSRDFENTAPQAPFLDTLGWVYVKMGQADQAVRLLQRATLEAPDRPVFHYHLGVAYYKAGEVKKGRQALTKALQSGKTFPGSEEAKALLAEKKG